MSLFVRQFLEGFVGILLILLVGIGTLITIAYLASEVNPYFGVVVGLLLIAAIGGLVTALGSRD